VPTLTRWSLTATLLSTSTNLSALTWQRSIKNEKTVSFLADTIGEAAWVDGMNPELTERQVNENPYKYVNE